MSDHYPEVDASAATLPLTLVGGVLARLEARRAALIPPATTLTTDPTDTPAQAPVPGARELSHLRRTLTDPRWEVRAAAAHALGALPGAGGQPNATFVTDACAALAEALHDAHRLVRAASAGALGRLAPFAPHDQQTCAWFVAQISGALNDTDWEPREAGVHALSACVTSGALAIADARPLLLAAAHDIASDVRVAASLALATSAAVETPAASATPVENPARAALTTAHALNGDDAQAIGDAAWPGRHAVRRLAQWGTLWLRQTRIMRREVWLVMLCGALAAVALTLAIRLHGGAYAYAAAVAFVLSGASATGVSFLAQTEHDPGLELTLATPVSLRAVLGGRIALVVGYNCALAVVASVVIGLIAGQSAWAVTQGWVGPLLLVSAIALAISLTVGSATAVCGALLLDTTQLLRALPTSVDGAPTVANALDTLRLLVAQVWGAHPATLTFVAALIIAAAVLAPQRALKQKEA